ncbi:MAG: DUF4111 domain-containing protein [Clostridia bacterium]|nr:DUF4111 domain-containing protein [Clostridia bacterium]
MKTDLLLSNLTAAYKNILGDNLTGIYIHGSLALGCFSWERGDVDFLVVVKDEPSLSEKTALIRYLLLHASDFPPKGPEMSVLTEDTCRNFVYPTPYVLHYSNYHKGRYEADLSGYAAQMRGYDPDLAAHITVTRAVGYPLCGPAVNTVFAPVPGEAYLDSIRRDVEHAREDIRENPVYVILNLCRVLAYLRDGAVLSKAAGGQWGMDFLPMKYQSLIAGAHRYYTDGVPFVPDMTAADRFAAFALAEIDRECGAL